MKYLSALSNEDYTLERVLYASGGAKKFFVTVADTDTTAKEEGVLIKFIGEDILGCDIKKNRGSVVQLDKRKASLHKHIVNLESISASKCETADLDIIVGNMRTGVVRKTAAFDTAIVRMEHECYEVSGYLGSVITQYKDIYKGGYVMSLYDVLGDLCLRTGHNLMQYKRIMITSRWRHTAFVIDLANTSQASIYFLKMYMDVMK